MTVNPCTGSDSIHVAYRMLQDFGSLHPGSVIIQNCANSGVGQAIIQLSKAWGYKSINVIRPRADLDKVSDYLYSLGADLVITDDQIRNSEIQKKIQAIGSPSLAFNGVGGKSATNIARLLRYLS